MNYGFSCSVALKSDCLSYAACVSGENTTPKSGYGQAEGWHSIQEWDLHAKDWVFTSRTDSPQDKEPHYKSL